MKIKRSVLLDCLNQYGNVYLPKNNIDFTFEMPALFLENAFCNENWLYIGDNYKKIPLTAKDSPQIGFVVVVPECVLSASDEILPNIILLSTTQSCYEIFHHVQEFSIIMQKWDTSLYTAVLQNQNVQALFDISENILGNPVVLLDPSMHASAYMSHIPTDDKLYVACITLGYHPADSMAIFRKFRILEVAHEEYEQHKRPIVIEPFESSPNKLVSYAIPICNNRYYITTMICDNRAVSDGLIEQFQHFVSYIVMVLNRDIKRQPDDDFFHEYFYSDILDKKLTDKKVIADRAKQFGLCDTGFFRLIKIELDTINYAQANWILNDIAHSFPNIKAFIYKSAVMAVLSFKSKGPEHEISLQKFMNVVKKINNVYHACCGVSNMFYHLIDLPKQYIQATEAVTTGKILKRKENSPMIKIEKLVDSSIFRYDELYIYHMIETTGKIVDKSALCKKELIDITEYDKCHQTNNFNLLYYYLIHERKATLTAQQLHMHRNNVLYRIRRIEELFGLNLENPEVRFNLLLTYKILFLDGEIGI